MYQEQVLALRKLNKLRVRNLLMEGLSYEEIAAQVGVAHRTVKKYVADLCDLYGVRRTRSKFNYVQLVVAVYKAGHCNCRTCRTDRGWLAGLPEPASTVPGSVVSIESARHGHTDQQLHQEPQHTVSIDVPFPAASTLLHKSKAKL